MKLEKAERLHWALTPVIEEAKLLIAHCEAIQWRIENVLSGEMPEEETLDEVGKMKGRVVMHWTKVKNNVDCILKHY